MTEPVTDHEFVPSLFYPDGEGCAYIVEGNPWTVFDPIRCRRPRSEHTLGLLLPVCGSCGRKLGIGREEGGDA